MSTLSFEEFPRLDPERLFQIQSDLGDEFPRFLILFAEHSKSLLATIQESLANNDLEQLITSLHSFKGMCGTMGGTRLFHLCKHAEAMASMGQLKTQQPLIFYIEMELLELDKEIKQALIS